MSRVILFGFLFGSMMSPPFEVTTLLAAGSMLDHKPFKCLALFGLQDILDTLFRRLQNIVNPLSHVLPRGFQFRSRGY